MSFPNATRLDRLLAPYADAARLAVRVWGHDAGLGAQRPPSLETECFGGPPLLVLLGAGSEGLVVLRQTHPHFEDLDGTVVPWPQVIRLERDPHLVRDVVRVEVLGHAPLFVSVSNHLLLPGNRLAAKALCDLYRGPDTRAAFQVEDIIPPYADAHPA